MGALHAGHAFLMQRARAECDCAVASVFVNPTQFGPNEDFSRYPRALESDCEKCREAGIDVLFAPCAEDMYPEGFDSWAQVGGIASRLEGERRPGHFRAVATVCAKLFNIVDPDRAYFGRKDYQQLKVIEQMVRDLNMRLEIVACETVREPDGLAMSSRNSYLNPEERKASTVLWRSLRAAKDAVEAGERRVVAVQIETIDNPAVILLAVRFGATRLIDNGPC